MADVVMGVALLRARCAGHAVLCCVVPLNTLTLTACSPPHPHPHPPCIVAWGLCRVVEDLRLDITLVGLVMAGLSVVSSGMQQVREGWGKGG